VSIEVSQTQVDLDSFSSSLEPIPSLEGIEEKPERPGELCSLSIPKLEPLDLGEEFKFENFPFLKYPEEFISEKRRGIQESTTETTSSFYKLRMIIIHPLLSYLCWK